MAIVIEQLTYRYGGASGGGRSRSDSAPSPMDAALNGVTMTIGEGEFLGVIGHTGSGKSTLMQQLCGLLTPTGGSVLVDGFDTRDKQQRKRARALVGLVFQYPEYQLFEETVEKDVAFGPKNLGLSDEEARAHAREALELVGLPAERFAGKSPFDLSGGEKRRAALAGILAMQPKYLALDEPMAGLDPQGRRAILALLERLRASTGCTVLMVSHSMDDVACHADRVAVLEQGRLCMLGKTAEVFSRAEELAQMGLAVPQAARLSQLLRARGLDAPPGAVHTETLTDWVLARWREGGAAV